MGLGGCPKPGGTAKPRPRKHTTLAAVGLDGQALDRSVRPCQDFYRFACGGWIKRARIPGDKARWYLQLQ